MAIRAFGSIPSFSSPSKPAGAAAGDEVEAVLSADIAPPNPPLPFLLTPPSSDDEGASSSTPSLDTPGSSDIGIECADRSSRGSSPSPGSKPAFDNRDRPSRAAALEGNKSSRVVSFSHSIPDDQPRKSAIGLFRLTHHTGA